MQWEQHSNTGCAWHALTKPLYALYATTRMQEKCRDMQTPKDRQPVITTPRTRTPCDVVRAGKRRQCRGGGLREELGVGGGTDGHCGLCGEEQRRHHASYHQEEHFGQVANGDRLRVVWLVVKAQHSTAQHTCVMAVVLYCLTKHLMVQILDGSNSYVCDGKKGAPGC